MGQGRKKREKDLDPTEAPYLPIPAEPNKRGGERDVENGGVQLHQIHRHNWGACVSSSSAATASFSEYARLPERMGDGYSHQSLFLQQQQQLQRPVAPSRLGGGGVRGGAVGEIVEVQGGHIVRSTGRKDRHSKVCTAKGPRDRRVRLRPHRHPVLRRPGPPRLRPPQQGRRLAHQERQGCHRRARGASSLDLRNRRLFLPPSSSSSNQSSTEQAAGESSRKPIPVADPVASVAFSFGGGGGVGGDANARFLPPSLDTDSIVDTIKSFPVAATSLSSTPSVGFHTYSSDLPSQASSQVKDLRLSLQSFQDPIFRNPESSHHHRHHGQYHQSSAPPTHDAHFPGSGQLAFGSDEQGHRVSPWNVVESSGGGGGHAFSFPPPQAVPLHSVLGHSQLFSQRGPLQSSNPPAIRAWADPAAAAADHRMQPALHPSISSIGYASGTGFSGFQVPARIQGEEEHDGIITGKPPSASSASRT
ncbi:hypothetical protein MUK42_36536 [Musa troglodytarum]|uniref:TCP domain-containing protein n=1 Tax=Musa troglodytarum TaxID=320322 RepID=A0A9E7IC13_9LILI|nr:hypothetical protein MUK42_36536 [Musa troglodytarum]